MTITKLEQAARQALEALREYRDTQMIQAPRKAIEALREALAEPDIEEMTLTQIAAKYEQAEQSSYAATPTTLAEPVAWWHPKMGAYDNNYFDAMQPLYLSPVRTKDLTELLDVMVGMANYIDKLGGDSKKYRAVIAADREKNK